MRKAKGSTARWLRRWGIMFSLAIVAGAGALVLAVHDTGLFELDGNATTQTFTDWDRVFADVTATPPGTTSGAIAQSWSADNLLGDGPSQNATIFTGGGSKDPQELTEWRWKDGAGGLPDKDNLQHAFAARYSVTPTSNCPAGSAATCDVLFFGSDRFDNSGDAQQGFWFLQKALGVGFDSNNDGVADTACPSGGGGGTPFCNPKTGAAVLHTPGDLLVISDFSNGGTTSTISVFVWDTTVSGNLRLLASSDNANCGTAAANDAFCGIVNPANGTIAPWPFVDKTAINPTTHPANTYLQGELYEAGINLSTLGLANECFSTLISETRSSTSTTATLKDFVLAPLGSCETGLSTTASLNGTGTTIAAGNGSTSGTASSGTDSATVTVKGVSTWAGNVDFYICGPMASASAVCDANGVKVGGSVAVSNTTPTVSSGSATLTSVGRYCWYAKFTPDQATADHGVGGADHAGTGSGTANLECFNVAGVIPTLSTQAGSSPVTFGNPVTDTATLGNLAKEPGSNGLNTTYPTINATNGVFAGAITFTLKGPADTGCGNNATGTGTNPQSVNVSSGAGNATYGPVSFTPNQPGKYHWQAQYANAQAVNNQATVTHNGSCTDANEDVVVNQIPTSILTAPFVYPQDTATISSSTGNLPAGGTVTFRLFNSQANCTAGADNITVGTGGLVFRQVFTSVASGSVSSVPLTTTNSSYSIDGTKTSTHYWRVDYAPGATTHTGRQSACVESTAVTIVGDAGPGTIFP